MQKLCKTEAQYSPKIQCKCHEDRFKVKEKICSKIFDLEKGYLHLYKKSCQCSHKNGGGIKQRFYVL